MSWTGIITSKPLSQITFILRWAKVTVFENIIKIVTKFFKDSKEVKRIRNYVPKCNLYLDFLI